MEKWSVISYGCRPRPKISPRVSLTCFKVASATATPDVGSATPCEAIPPPWLRQLLGALVATTTMAYPSPLHKLVAMVEKETKERKKHIVFFHPDLGIGGAERLIIDAAVGLQKRGHRVTIFTSHCDSRHCFDEARDGSWFACPV